MRTKILVITILGLLLIGSVTFSFYNEKGEVKENMEGIIYQGPVPLGYDLDHFRKTGETIREIENDG